MTGVAAAGLTEIPAARPNWQCVDDYPDNLGDESYCYSENGINADAHTIRQIEDLSYKINSVRVVTLCRAENLVNASEAVPGFFTGGVWYWGDAVILDVVYEVIEGSWTVNPDTALFWDRADLATLNAAIQLTSAGVGTEARVTQMYLEIDVTPLGETVTNISGQHSDPIFVDQGFNVLLELDETADIFDATAVEISYRDPQGNELNLDAEIFDGTMVFTTVPANLNTVAGKWRFKPIITLASGAVIEGREKMVNVREQWPV
jgi:hypothetical protein